MRRRGADTRSRRFALALAALLCASCAPVLHPVGTPGQTPAGGPANPPAAPATPAETAGPPAHFDLHSEPMIDVGLAWDLDSASVRLVGDAGLALDRAGGARVEATSKWERRVTVRLRSGHADVEADDMPGVRIETGDTLVANGSGTNPGEARALWNESTWRGSFRIFLNPRGRLTIVDRLPLEAYLLGVVPGEIGGLDDKLVEAGRAQAIAARSYTLFYRGRRAAEGFDLYGTVEDQVYGPTERERPIASKCVEATRGELLLSEGQPIRANYCSTCGGISAEVWEAWPAPALPYLVSHPDRGSSDWCASSPQYRWREQWSATEFLDNLRKFAPAQSVALPPDGAGELLDVRVASRSRSGRVWRLEVATSTGAVTIPAYSIRQVLRRGGNPGAILRSNLFKIGVRRDPATHRAVAVVATGAGSGHGVGLCQTGALGMARSGASAASILAHYYPTAALEKRY